MQSCQHCSAELSPSSVSLHWSRFHSSPNNQKPSISCRDCDVAGSELVYILAHCLLHGHDMPLFAKAIVSIPSFRLDETEANQPSPLIEGHFKEPEANIDVQKMNMVEEHFMEPEALNVQKRKDRSSKTAEMEFSDFYPFREESGFSPVTTSKEDVVCETNDTEQYDRTITTLIRSSDSEPPKPALNEPINQSQASSNPKSATCHQCSTSISLSTKHNAIDHTCACQQVKSPSFAENEQDTPYLKCTTCGSPISWTSKKTTNVIDHVCACHKIKPYGCSNCGYTFAQRSKARRHIKVGRCAAGNMMLIENLNETGVSHASSATEEHFMESGPLLESPKKKNQPPLKISLNECNDFYPLQQIIETTIKEQDGLFETIHTEPTETTVLSNSPPFALTEPAPEEKIDECNSSSNQKSATCHQCSSLISLSTKHNAIDHVCACRQVKATSCVQNEHDDGYLGYLQCATCGSRISLTGRKNGNAVEHVSACHKIKPYGCSNCGANFAKRGHAGRHLKTSGACSGGDVTMLHRH